MSSRTLPVAIVALLVGSGLLILPPAAAQGTGLTIPDPTNDVVFTPQGLAGAGDPLPAPFPGGTEQVLGIADLTEVRVGDETPTALTFAYKVQAFERSNTVIPTGALHRICFAWDGSGADYQFILNFFYGDPTAEPTAVPSLIEARFERLSGPCDPFHTADSTPFLDTTHFTVAVDYEANEVQIQMQREKLSLLSGDAENPDPMPLAGDTLTVQGYATGAIGASQVFYDETASDIFTFASDTANRLVRVIVPENLAGAFGVQSRGVPIYGVEVNSFQIVPLTLENHLDTPIQPEVKVQVIEGDAAKWDVRSVPPIPVGKKNGDNPGRETVSLVVNTAGGVDHKERMRLLVTAVDPAHPQHLGGAVVDIVAVHPPVAGADKLYFHGTGDACNTERRWLNTLSSDPSGAGAAIDFHNCQGNIVAGTFMTSGDVHRVFYPDVPFGRNYELSTTQPAMAHLVLKSVMRLPGQQPVELPVPTPADLVVQVFAGQKLLGEGIMDVEIQAEDTPFDVPVSIVGQTLTSLTREVDAETPLNIIVGVLPKTRTFEYCAEDPCGFHGEVEVPGANGMVYMQMAGSSWITLPIAASERAGEIVNITKSGALISLRLSQGQNQVFTNPGRIVVFNLTVRNEGVNVDTARLSAQVNRTGWSVEILPATEYQLKVGQPRAFNLKVTAPPDARESDRVRIDVHAASTVDPEASARLPLYITATTQQQFNDQELDPNLQKVDKNESTPGAAFAPVALALLGLAFVLRRRRSA